MDSGHYLFCQTFALLTGAMKTTHENVAYDILPHTEL